MATGSRGERAMDEVTARRLRRAQGQRILDALAVDYLERTDVGRAPMFGSLGLVLGGRFFAFVGREGQLVVKLPVEQASALIEAGAVQPVRAGRSVTREWVGAPLSDDDAERRRWGELLDAAWTYATSPGRDPRRDRSGSAG